MEKRPFLKHGFEISPGLYLQKKSRTEEKILAEAPSPQMRYSQSINCL